MAIKTVQMPSSRNISNGTYDDETQTLTITFVKGNVYEYYQVDESTVNGFAQALSATEYLNTFIANAFPSQRVF